MRARLPLVHTLVATNSFARTLSSDASCPVTDSDDPYIGELSTTRAPRPTKVLGVSLAWAISPAWPATSNTCHVPRPIAGTDSPAFGMRRSRTPSPLDSAGISMAPRATAPDLRKARRVAFGPVTTAIVGDQQSPRN